MADAPFGFRPVRHMGTYSGQVISAVIPATDSTAVFVGDLVSLAAGQDTVDNMMTVTQTAAANTQIVGAVVGFEPDYSDLTLKHRAASTKRIARIAPALPGVVFECQASAAMSAGDVGGNVEVTVGAGSTTTGRSAMEADLGSAPIATTAQLQIIGPSLTVGETFDTSAAGTNIYVLVNESIFTQDIGVS